MCIADVIRVPQELFLRDFYDLFSIILIFQQYVCMREFQEMSWAKIVPLDGPPSSKQCYSNDVSCHAVVSHVFLQIPIAIHVNISNQT